jgi:pimeloyl-ACP methyl ester carboxylesterase
MAYVEWGDPNNSRVLLCVHGLTRCGRDFDFLAQQLAGDYRVVCPDVVGRGRSEWLADKSLYDIPQYVEDMRTLLTHIGVEQVHWLGTSMGGLIGMEMAAGEDSPISRLVLNDVGPVLTAASIARIGQYVGMTPHFADYAQIEAFVRMVSAPFGSLDDAQWRHLTEHVVMQDTAGQWLFKYDPGIAVPFRAAVEGNGAGGDLTRWPQYDAIRCPTLVVRGESSDLLTRETVAEMSRRGPQALSVELPGVGHAPMFLDAAQVAVVRDFLLG